MALRELLPNIYRYEDSCHVYIVRKGDRAIAIDFGTGGVLDELSSIGVSHLDWVVHTHHHRDQCEGDHLAVEQGAKIAVPEWEAHYFSEAEHFWGRRSIMHLYNMRTNFFTLRESVPVSGVLQDFTSFEWNGLTLDILPAPGHTEGGVAFVLGMDGKRVGFVGDLIRDDGQAETIHDLQYNYGGWEGMPMSMQAMDYLFQQSPDILFPSHGEPVDDPEAGIKKLTDAMRAWLAFYGGGGHDFSAAELKPVIPDVYFSKFTNANHYVVLSKSGKALFVDYGPNYGTGLVADLLHADESNRFVPHSLPELKAMGMTEVDVAMPSHYHDDHITGFAYLQRKEGTKIWCYKNMVD
ncbi:MAG: MBL fold metallo-hydrolase, partial [Candidatus Latescibacteria bacterium]|nr:MBL fold metallo-hydrolase [Candidatus Latescibacterota bacterium]